MFFVFNNSLSILHGQSWFCMMVCVHIVCVCIYTFAFFRKLIKKSRYLERYEKKASKLYTVTQTERTFKESVLWINVRLVIKIATAVFKSNKYTYFVSCKFLYNIRKYSYTRQRSSIFICSGVVAWYFDILHLKSVRHI